MTSYNWWEENLPDKEKMKVFAGWLGERDAISRMALKNKIERLQKTETVTDILECGAGLCVDSKWITEMGLGYHGVDFTKLLVERAKSLGLDVVEGNINSIPYDDEKFDIVYCRHVLEHLPYYETALKEMLRVAKKQVNVVFFLPLSAEEKIIFTESMQLHHNVYSKEKMFSFIKSLGYKFWYEEIKAKNDEAILTIHK